MLREVSSGHGRNKPTELSNAEVNIFNEKYINLHFQCYFILISQYLLS